MRKTLLWMISAAVLVSGCVSVKATRMNLSKEYAPLTAEQVVYYTSKDKVPVPYEEVAMLTAKGDDDMTSESGMMEAMRKKAEEVGANGVYVEEMKGASTGAKIASAFFGTSKNRKANAIAVYVLPGAKVPQ
jgi:hypothetical protein